MNEINFFEHKKKKIKFNVEFSYTKYAIPVLIIILLTLYLLPTFQQRKLDAKLKELKNSTTSDVIEDVLTPASFENIETKKQTVEQIEKIQIIESVSSELLESIKLSIPNTLFLNDMTIINGELTISGFAKSSNTIAQFQSNLEKDSTISDVLVSDIVKELGNYSFKLTAKVGS